MQMGACRVEERFVSGATAKLDGTAFTQDGHWVVPSLTISSHLEDSDGCPEGGQLGWSHEEADEFAVVAEAGAVVKQYKLDEWRDPRGALEDRTVDSGRRLAFASDQPFGVITWKTVDGQRVGGEYFYCARQVHRGELGRRPQIKRPQFARQAPEFPPFEAGTRQRDRRRGKVGWARLADVAKLAGMNACEMVERFFPFTDKRQPKLHVLTERDREHIHCQQLLSGAWQTVSFGELPELFGDHDMSRMWIRAGFAATVLYLRSLGYTPDLPNKAEAVAA